MLHITTYTTIMTPTKITWWLLLSNFLLYDHYACSFCLWCINFAIRYVRACFQYWNFVHRSRLFSTFKNLNLVWDCDLDMVGLFDFILPIFLTPEGENRHTKLNYCVRQKITFFWQSIQKVIHENTSFIRLIFFTR